MSSPTTGTRRASPSGRGRLVRAGTEAERVYAHPEALRHFQRALELLEAGAASGDLDRVELTERLPPRLRTWPARPSSRSRPAERAVELAEPACAGRQHAWLAQTLWDGGRGPDGLSVELAAALTPPDHTADRARILDLEVEIVGRLVEQQQVGLGKQRCCEPNAHAPAAGELAAGALLIGMGEAEAGENGGRARRRRMGANVREPRLNLGNSMGVALGRCRKDEARALGVGREHDIQKAFVAIRSLLRQPADPAAHRQLHIASFRRDLSGDDPQQRGFSCAVAADKADPGTSRQSGSCMIQQRASADLAGDVVEAEHAAL